ncbi:hypothetical protein [Sulfurovum sp.]|uniref:hypothetical protein n=1 Tax=Sulfurovum sp. TaxID=1969726 RepID=UPI003564FC6B
MLSLTPNPKMQFFDSGGNFLVLGKVYTYEAGTSTPLATYTDSTGAQENTNPIILDAKGQASIWLSANAYKFVVYDADDVLQPDGGDNIDPLSFATEEWVDTADVPTFIDATSFSVPNDRTLSYEDYRAIKLTVSAGTVYGHVISSTFGSGITTVTVRLKSGSVDSGISATSLGLITSTSTSMPFSTLILSEDTTDLAAATTTNVLGTQSSTIHITGASPITITSFGVSLREGLKHRVTSTGAGAHVLTHNATSLILPGGIDITVAQGDSWTVEDLGSNNCRVHSYTRASGFPITETIYDKLISGLVPSNNGSDPAKDIDISAGFATDTTGAYYMNLPTSFTKQLDAIFAEGTSAGGLFFGTIAADTWYAIHLIRKDSDGSIDVGFDTSSTAANIPTGYTYYRHIGWVLTDATPDIIAFKSVEIAGGAVDYVYNSTITDISRTLSTSRLVETISAPPDTRAHLDCRVNGTTTSFTWVHPTHYIDAAADSSNSHMVSSSASTNPSRGRDIELDSSSQIASRSSAAANTLTVSVTGFLHRRV